ncbi:MAG: aquaporin family protein [Acidimicrobiia bacterium]|nr:aquaporin family protein [Acidimicrobiia bacterium]NNL29127.1 aquaporin family protein [Acidimicrobiia bacterium]
MSRLTRQVLAEFVGTAFLLAGIVGSGIMAERLTSDPGLQLLQNAIATAAVLTAVILALGPVSGAHLNPAVTIADRVFGGLTTREAAAYILGQISGGIVGVVTANLMFDLSAVTFSTTERAGSHLWLAEVVATLGLLLVIFGLVRSQRTSAVAFAVGAYIAGAFYFTSSTSFANPAVTIARSLSDTFAGIDPANVPGFLLAELMGTAVAVGLIMILYPRIGEVADQVLVPHDAE